MATSSNLLPVPSRATARHGAQPSRSQRIYPDEPPSYDDIYPSSNPNPEPIKIPGDHKIQHPDKTTAPPGWDSDSSVTSLHSRAARSDTPSSAEEDSDADSILQQALAFTSRPVAPHALSRRLGQPIAIPQVVNGAGKPFARAYSPRLAEAKGIGAGEFVEFIDNLNVVSAGSPPLQVLGLVGGVVGLIPDPDAMLVGAGVQALAALGTVVVSRVRGSRFLRKANERLFAPRGLKVELVTGEALRAKLGLAADAPLCVPVEVAGGMSVHERRVAALRGHASDGLTFEVPPPSAPSTVLDRMSAAQQKRTLEKQERKALERREKYHEKQEKYGEGSERVQRDLDRCVRRLEEKMARADLKKERKVERILNRGDRRADRKLERVERRHARTTARIDRDLAREHRDHSREKVKLDKSLQKNDREARVGQKVLWIYIDEL